MGRVGGPDGPSAGLAGAAAGGDPAGAAAEVDPASAALAASSAARLAPPPDMLAQSGQQVPFHNPCIPVKAVCLHARGISGAACTAGHIMTG